jgi:Flp pilus assembly protein TadG
MTVTRSVAPKRSKLQSSPSNSSKRRGTAVVEFSLCLPLLLGMALGFLQFGYAYYVYGELEHAIRAAGRYAAQRNYGSLTTTPDSAYLTAVRNVAVYANPAGGTQPVAPGLSTANVSVTVTFSNGVPSVVNVAINGYSLPRIIGSISLTNKPVVQFPYVGIFAPPVS